MEADLKYCETLIKKERFGSTENKNDKERKTSNAKLQNMTYIKLRILGRVPGEGQDISIPYLPYLLISDKSLTLNI